MSQCFIKCLNQMFLWEFQLFLREFFSFRFTRYIDFLDWSTDDCMKFIEKKAHNDNYILDEKAKKIIGKGAARVRLIIFFKESSASIQHNFLINVTLLIVSCPLLLSAPVSTLKRHQIILCQFCLEILSTIKYLGMIF